MNIVYCAGRFPKLSESFILSEIVELKRRGHNVVVFARSDPQEKVAHDELADLDVQIHYAGEPELTAHCARNVTQTFGDLRFWSSRSTFTEPARQMFHAHLLAEFEIFLSELPWTPDCIHAHFAVSERLPISHATKKHGIPMSIVPHAAGLFSNPNYDALKTLFNNVDHIVSPTKYNKRYIEEHYLPNVPISVVPAVSQLGARESAGETVPNRILTVGRFVEKKGYPYAVEAISEVIDEYPGVEYHIVGSGSLETEIRSRIREHDLGENVEILQQIPDDQLSREYDEAAIFLLPCVIASDGDRDAAPVVLKEAMTMETACVSTTVSAIPELITDGETGLLVPPRDATATAEAVKSLLSNPNYRNELAAAGRKHVTENLTPEKAVDRLEQVFYQIVDDKVPRANTTD